MKTIESRIADLERSNRDLSIKLSSLMLNLSRLAIRQSDCHEDNADNIGKVDGKAEATDGRVDEIEESVELDEETLDFLSSEVLPEQNENISDLADTVDFILTEILPTKADIE